MSDNPSDLDKNLIQGHEYDGIKELDNPLPAWWLTTFLGSVIFGFIYWVHYDLTHTGPTQKEELEADLKAIESKQAAGSVGADGNDGDTGSPEQLLALISDPQSLAGGKSVYAARCAACHGGQGEGMIGPNLTDNFWIHGKGEIAQIADVVRNGVIEKGMPAWKDMLKTDEVNNVIAFVASLKGTNVPGGKKPDGEEVK